MQSTPTPWIPYLVAFNLTQQCNLACAHCYLDAHRRMHPNPDELNFEQWATLFHDIGKRAPGTIAVLTGGEPLLRDDIEDLVSEGARAGLRMTLGTNGLLLTVDKIQKLQQRGLQGVGISLDSSHPAGHDTFRGLPGAFTKTCTAIRACVAQGLHVQIHFTITRKNRDELSDIVDLSRSLGVNLVNFFFLVCVGRGNAALDLNAEEYEESLIMISKLQNTSKGMMVQARCAPHYKRILYEQNPESEFTRAEGYDGGGCPAATHYARINPKGEMTPCPYMELSGGNILQKSFWEIWDGAPLFHSFRNTDLLQGRCGGCEFKQLCGGCRARALAQTGNLLAEDPNCRYEPKGVNAIQPRMEIEKDEVIWTDEAKHRLRKMPILIRPMVKRKLESRARRENIPITAELMQRHRAEREAELGIKFGETSTIPSFKEMNR